LALMRASVEKNHAVVGACSVRVEQLDWGCDIAALPPGPFDLILGSDIVWADDDDNHAALCASVRDLLNRDLAPWRRPRAVLAVQHGLPLDAAGEAGEAATLLVDETIEQLRAAAALCGLHLLPLDEHAPAHAAGAADAAGAASAEATATDAAAAETSACVGEAGAPLCWPASRFGCGAVCFVELRLNDEHVRGVQTAPLAQPLAQPLSHTERAVDAPPLPCAADAPPLPCAPPCDRPYALYRLPAPAGDPSSACEYQPLWDVLLFRCVHAAHAREVRRRRHAHNGTSRHARMPPPACRHAHTCRHAHIPHLHRRRERASASRPPRPPRSALLCACSALDLSARVVARRVACAAGDGGRGVGSRARLEHAPPCAPPHHGPPS
jgi:hypothetical protein